MIKKLFRGLIFYILSLVLFVFQLVCIHLLLGMESGWKWLFLLPVAIFMSPVVEATDNFVDKYIFKERL
jgi:hypothetical protein